jgi:hypothetical protein
MYVRQRLRNRRPSWIFAGAHDGTPLSSHGAGRGDRLPSLSLKGGLSELLHRHGGCSAQDMLAEFRGHARSRSFRRAVPFRKVRP